MADATFRHGDPKMIDFTPASGDIDAGDIVLLGNTTGITCGVAHRDIANGELGALAAGMGIYDVKVASNYARGTKVHFDGTDTLTSTSTNNAQFGFTVEAAAAANDVVKVLHFPYVPV